MLARLEPANGVLGVHAVRENDIDDVYIRIVLDRVVVLVVINVLWIHGVAQRELVGFVRVAAYEGRDLRFLAFRKGWKDLMDGEVTEADDGPAEFLAGRVGSDHL